MEDINMILILCLLLVIFFMILTHVNIDFYNYPITPINGKCSETKFGCCPDGKNSKINFYGTNCPPYNPGHGYDPTPYPPVPYPPVPYPPVPYPPVPNPPIPVPPGPQPYYASQPQLQPQVQQQTQIKTIDSRPRPLHPLSSTFTSHPPIPPISETASSPDYNPGPRPPKAAGGIGTHYPN